MNLHQYSLNTIMLAAATLSQRLLAYSVYAETDLTPAVASFTSSVKNAEDLFKIEFAAVIDDANNRTRMLADVTKAVQSDLVFERFDYWQAEILAVVSCLNKVSMHLAEFSLLYNYQSHPNAEAQAQWHSFRENCHQAFLYLTELRRKGFYTEPTEEEYCETFLEWKELKNKIGLQAGTVFKLASYSLNGLK